jgi:polygalacturonase
MKTGVILVLLLTAAWLGAQNRVRVRNGRELAQAIGSDRLVVLAEGEYRVSEAAQAANPAVSWEPVFDGLQLVVTGVRHLTLRGEKGANLLASPRYAYTLVFRDCHELRLQDLTLGHTEAGECVGGVLRLEGCSGVLIEDCQLFGSGVVGLDLEGCTAVTVLRSTIRDCTSGALSAAGVQNLLLDRVDMQGNQSRPLIWIDSSRKVLLDSCRIEGNTGSELFWIGPEAEGVSLRGCRIEGNQVKALSAPGSREPQLVQTSIVGNAFEAEEEMVESGEEEKEDYTWPEYEQ